MNYLLQFILRSGEIHPPCQLGHRSQRHIPLTLKGFSGRAYLLASLTSPNGRDEVDIARLAIPQRPARSRIPNSGNPLPLQALNLLGKLSPELLFEFLVLFVR